MSVVEDPRFPRLPKWAQRGFRENEEEIRRLEAELLAARTLLRGGDEDTASIVVDVYSDNRQYLPTRPETPVEFRFKREEDRWWRYFLVSLSPDNRLNICGSEGILVKPSSGNAISVWLEGR